MQRSHVCCALWDELFLCHCLHKNNIKQFLRQSSSVATQQPVVIHFFNLLNCSLILSYFLFLITFIRYQLLIYLFIRSLIRTIIFSAFLSLWRSMTFYFIPHKSQNIFASFRHWTFPLNISSNMSLSKTLHSFPPKHRPLPLNCLGLDVLNMHPPPNLPKTSPSVQPQDVVTGPSTPTIAGYLSLFLLVLLTHHTKLR